MSTAESGMRLISNETWDGPCANMSSTRDRSCWVTVKGGCCELSVHACVYVCVCAFVSLSLSLPPSLPRSLDPSLPPCVHACVCDAEVKHTSLHLMPVWVSLHKELGVRVLLCALVDWGHVRLQTDHLHLQNTGLWIVLHIGPLERAAILVHQTEGTQWEEGEKRRGKRRGKRGRGGKSEDTQPRVCCGDRVCS